MKLNKIYSVLLLFLSVSIAHATVLVTDDVVFESNHSTIADTLNTSLQWVDNMMVDRQGNQPDSNMTALGLHQNVKNTACYTVFPTSGLTEAACTEDSINLEDYVAANSVNVDAPRHVEVTADWINDQADIGGNENILGDNVVLAVDSADTTVTVPVVEAEDNALLYYGATLVDAGSRVAFPNDSYPIWKMQLGRYYVDNFLMTDKGKGFYLEYHRDRPHWHQPLSEDAGGFYLLAKAAGVNASGKTIYHLTGFRIPYGKAVYSRMGAIHADPALTGSVWAVGYSDSDDFSTALVRNRDGQMIRFVPAQ
ncbi:hypothetical protein [Kistimonas asteriae]|uniref:hypothetical protein n=1 Tax=Kistimonas asteriae TaxID=517724 RepID=UPI001BAC3BFB|nr:hypothetical protein [Kistimonas asteriae]